MTRGLVEATGRENYSPGHRSALIYFVEENSHFLGYVRPFFQALEQGTFTAVTSTLTITETLVKPLQLGQADRVHTFREVLANIWRSCR